MRALLNHLFEQGLVLEQFENLVLVGCGLIQDLPERHRALARNFVYIEPNPRFTDINRQAVRLLTNSRFMDEALGLEDSHHSNFYQFNLPQFDGLIPLADLQVTAGNLRLLSTVHVRSRSIKNLLAQFSLEGPPGSVCLVLDAGELSIQALQDIASCPTVINRVVLVLPKQICLPSELSGWLIEHQGNFGLTAQQLLIMAPTQPESTSIEFDADSDALSELKLRNAELKHEVELLRARVAELEFQLEQSHASEPKDYVLALKQAEERNRLTNNELLKGFAQIDLIKELMLKDNLS